MYKYETIKLIEKLYKSNSNILENFKKKNNTKNNTEEGIMISYDFQSGTYVEAYKNNEIKMELELHWNDILNYLQKYCNGKYSILECGVGEATAFSYILKNLNIKPYKAFGFDISWSRIKIGTEFLKENFLEDKADLFVANMFDIPFKDESVDIVYTVHAMEPNGGNEEKLLKELYRVTKKYLLLFEPIYELASDEQKRRMEHHGYIKNLRKICEKLGYKITDYRLLNHHYNILNKTGVIVIEKAIENCIECEFCDPISKRSFIKGSSSYYCPDSFLAYPIVEGIPCLNKSNAILATKWEKH